MPQTVADDEAGTASVLMRITESVSDVSVMLGRATLEAAVCRTPGKTDTAVQWVTHVSSHYITARKAIVCHVQRDN